MKLSESIKSISYLKAHASDLVREVVESRKPLIITQNGEAKVVIQDLESYDELNESLAMLKMLAESSKSKTADRYKSVKKTFEGLEKRARQTD